VSHASRVGNARRPQASPIREAPLVTPARPRRNGPHSSFMGEIHEFIRDRVYEDASAALASYRHAPEERSDHGPDWGPRRVLAECEIKREIVRTHDGGACPQCVVSPELGCETVRLLAQAWPDHPDYRSDWNSFHDGDSQISPSRATEIIEELSRPDRSSAVKLTDRETEVLLLIAEGVSYRDIGQRLFVSLNTVRNHARISEQKSELHRRLGDGPGPGGWPA
jgi:DNA-binding CsgD family transcriptional regulator